VVKIAYRRPGRTQLRWRPVTVVVFGLAIGLAGCSSDGTPATQPVPSATASIKTADVAPSAQVSTPAVDAAAVLAALSSAGLPMSHGSVQDEDSDPNNLLGRPNGYLSRASFDVPGADVNADKYDIDRGGVIEVWPDAASAKARSDYIQGVLKAAPMLGTEYDYLSGSVLVRLSGRIKPSVATKFATAVAALPVH
jgi:hypothetical protein